MSRDILSGIREKSRLIMELRYAPLIEAFDKRGVLLRAADNAFKAKMEQAGFVPQGMGIEESHKYLEAEVKEHLKLAQEFDLKKQ
mgnify:CR=1 FL=1